MDETQERFEAVPAPIVAGRRYRYTAAGFGKIKRGDVLTCTGPIGSGWDFARADGETLMLSGVCLADVEPMPAPEIVAGGRYRVRDTGALVTAMSAGVADGETWWWFEHENGRYRRRPEDVEPVGDGAERTAAQKTAEVMRDAYEKVTAGGWLGLRHRFVDFGPELLERLGFKRDPYAAHRNTETLLSPERATWEAAQSGSAVEHRCPHASCNALVTYHGARAGGRTVCPACRRVVGMS